MPEPVTVTHKAVADGQVGQVLVFLKVKTKRDRRISGIGENGRNDGNNGISFAVQGQP